VTRSTPLLGVISVINALVLTTINLHAVYEMLSFTRFTDKMGSKWGTLT